MRFKAWHAPARLATGAFILNSGLAKLQSEDEERDKAVHGMASGVYPQLEGMQPRQFVKVLGMAETALGAALLTPFVGPGLAGAGLGAFSGGLIYMYLNTPGMTKEDGIRPSPQGTAVAKDVWMGAIAAGLLMDAVGDRIKRLRPGK